MVTKPSFVDVVRDRGETIGEARPPAWRMQTHAARACARSLACRSLGCAALGFARVCCGWPPTPAPAAPPAHPHTGIAEFETRDEMDTVIRKLDDTEFKNPFDQCYIRIQEDYGGGGGGGGGGWAGGRRAGG
jgi:hypothetical protein